MTTHLRTIIFVLGVMFGIVIGEKSLYATEILLACLIIFLSQLVVYFVSVRQSVVTKIPIVIMLVSLGILLGAIRSQFTEEIKTVTCEKSCQVEGLVIKKGASKDTYQLFDVEIDDGTNRIRVRSPLYPEYSIGDRVVLSGVVQESKNLAPHGSEQTFDYGSYLHLNRVGSEMYYPKIIVSSTTKDFPLYFRLRLFQSGLVERINTYVSRPASYLANGMLLGVTNFSQEMTDMFRVAGLSHIVVLSGFNITVLIIFVLFVLRPFPVVVRALLSIALVVLFVVMVGGGASLVRASLMAGIALLALVLGRGYVAHQALMLSFLAIIFYSPFSLLHDVSLHLSFLATCGIIYGYEIFKNFFLKYVPSFFIELLSATLAAYLFTLPYILYTFGAFSVYAIIANLLVLPFVPVTMSFTAITLLLSFISTHLAIFFGMITTILSNSIVWIVQVITALPFAKAELHISFGAMITIYLFLVFVMAFFRTRVENETTETKEAEIISPIMRF
jgi:competence protein ComEC